MTADHETLAAALVAALAELTDVPRTRTADMGTYTVNYADLAAAMAAIRPVLAKHGLAVMQPVDSGDRGPAVSTIILHRSGEQMVFGPLSMPGGSSPQGTGSAITYARRYSLLAALGLCATDDDDDGSQAQREAAPPRQARSAPRKAAGATQKSGGGDHAPHAPAHVQAAAEAAGKPTAAVLAAARKIDSTVRSLNDVTPELAEQVARTWASTDHNGGT